VPIDTKLSVGNAVVDLRLPDAVRQGETVAATVQTEAGDEPQRVEAVWAVFDVAYESEGAGNPDSLHTLGRQLLVEEPFVVEPGEENVMSGPLAGDDGDDEGDGLRSFEVKLRVPEAAPVTRPPAGEGFPDGDGSVAGYPTVAVETSMDGEFAVGPEDEDPLTVEMGGRFETFHRATTGELDFELARVERGRLQEGLKRWTQRFEYEPTPASPYHGVVDEVEAQLDYGHEGPGLGLAAQFEGVDESPLELGESYEPFVVESTDPAAVAGRVRERLDEV
jgi:sporulation-control protein spo0M